MAVDAGVPAGGCAPTQHPTRAVQGTSVDWNTRVPVAVTCKHTTPQTLRAHADPRLSASTALHSEPSIFPCLYPLPQTCAEERPNLVSKQCNSDVTSVQFMKLHWNKSWHVRSQSSIQDNSTHSQAQKHSYKPSVVFTNIKTGTYN